MNESKRDGMNGKGKGMKMDGRKKVQVKSEEEIQLENTIQYKYEYYYSGINPVEFRGQNNGIILSKCSFFKLNHSFSA